MTFGQGYALIGPKSPAKRHRDGENMMRIMVVVLLQKETCG